MTSTTLRVMYSEFDSTDKQDKADRTEVQKDKQSYLDEIDVIVPEAEQTTYFRLLRPRKPNLSLTHHNDLNKDVEKSDSGDRLVGGHDATNDVTAAGASSDEVPACDIMRPVTVGAEHSTPAPSESMERRRATELRKQLVAVTLRRKSETSLEHSTTPGEAAVPATSTGQSVNILQVKKVVSESALCRHHQQACSSSLTASESTNLLGEGSRPATSNQQAAAEYLRSAEAAVLAERCVSVIKQKLKDKLKEVILAKKMKSARKKARRQRQEEQVGGSGSDISGGDVSPHTMFVDSGNRWR